jgi:hypothetical protein
MIKEKKRNKQEGRPYQRHWRISCVKISKKVQNLTGVAVPRLMEKVYLATDVSRKIMICVVVVHVVFSTHWFISYAAIFLQYVVAIVRQQQSNENKLRYFLKQKV